MPARSRVLVASRELVPRLTIQSTPFSAWRLPKGTTRLELVTSGRSVTIASATVGHSPALAERLAPGAKRNAQHSSAGIENPDLFRIPAFPGRALAERDSARSIWSEGLVRLTVRWGTEPEGWYVD